MQRARQLCCGLWRTSAQPRYTPMHDVGCQTCKYDLQANAHRRTTHEMLHLEDATLQFLVAGLDQLPSVVGDTPVRQRARPFIVSELQQRRVLVSIAKLKPFERQSQ